ncbi:ABC transporter substrate-binding protein [Pseudoalteromonas ruthenica]|uniref:ABC transporter substrate-binding protein n=2 Tax=Pseudoalteromonas TaxID=53246 RepID=UPI00242047CB|nr:ABC transporter substrate-binding protein [Pseudoalteromonas ruthenica]|tara:strand:+ start:64865 stop:65827 length:963 start_codon:yes stop_codon:yes gene_type:complete
MNFYTHLEHTVNTITAQGETMLKPRQLLVATLVLCTAWSTKAQTVEKIIWLQSKTPPFHLPRTTEYPFAGLCDELLNQLITKMPGIEHEKLLLPQKRIHRYMNEGEKVCFPCMIHRNKDTHTAKLSIPTAVYPPFTLITTVDKRDQLTQAHGKPINLASLFADDSFTYGQVAARRFSGELQTLLQQTAHSRPAVLSYRADGESGAIAEMLQHDIIDYTLDYPYMARYFAKKYGNIRALETNLTQDLVRGAVGCSASAADSFAEQAISAINKALKQDVLENTNYVLSQRFWLAPYFTDFDAVYKTHVLKATDEQPPSTQDP